MGGQFWRENDPEIAEHVKGWKRHLNSYTIRGRRNWVLLTYAMIGLPIYYFSRKPKAAAIKE